MNYLPHRQYALPNQIFPNRNPEHLYKNPNNRDHHRNTPIEKINFVFYAQEEFLDRFVPVLYRTQALRL